MKNKNDGGPAFPGSKKVKTGMTAYEEIIPISGMSLRDYFAASARSEDYWEYMIKDATGGTRDTIGDRVNAKYKYEDAMLLERDK